MTTENAQEQAHAGSVQPRDGGGFTWECVCGERPDSLTHWGSFDAAARALHRHIVRRTLARDPN